MVPTILLMAVLGTAPLPVIDTIPADTLRLEVGSPETDARVYVPHRARVRIRLDGPTGQIANEWVNELVLGDSAGRPVMRWTTTSMIGPQKGNVLRQTYDGITMAPLGYLSEQVSGARTQLRFEGTRVVGTRRTASDPTEVAVDMTLDRRGFFAGASDLLPPAVGIKPGQVLTVPVWAPGMKSSELRVFTVVGRSRVDVEGKTWDAWKVEERVSADRRLLATYYFADEVPYMLAGEMISADGRTMWATDVALPPADGK